MLLRTLVMVGLVISSVVLPIVSIVTNWCYPWSAYGAFAIAGLIMCANGYLRGASSHWIDALGGAIILVLIISNVIARQWMVVLVGITVSCVSGAMFAGMLARWVLAADD